MRATAAALITGRRAMSFAPAALKKFVAVAPGHNVVTVTPVPRSSGFGEIGGNNDGARAVCLQLGGERLHCRHSARAEYEIVAVFRQLASEIGADAARSSGDQRQRAGRVGHGRYLRWPKPLRRRP